MHTKHIPSGSNLLTIEAFDVLESLPDAAVLMDKNGLILNTNTLFAAQVGMEPKKCCGSRVYDLLTTMPFMPDLATQWQIKSTEVFSSRQRTIFEERSDKLIWKITINPVISQKNETTCLFITIQDISEQVRRENEAKKEHTLKTALLETIPGAIVILDSQGHVTGLNPYTCDVIFGKSQDEMLNCNLAEFVDSDDISPLREKFLNILNNGVEESAEVKIYPHGKETVLWLFIHAKRVILDNEPSVVAVGINITERKRIEYELLQSKQRFSYALDAARSGIWEWDIVTDTLSWSDQVWALYGLEVNSEQLNHQLCVNTVHPDDREITSRIIRDAVGNKTAAFPEYRVCYPDASIHWLVSRGMPLFNDNGKLTRYIGTIIDITERKESELALRKSKALLNQALEAARAGIWEWNLETDENLWSDEIWPLYGLKSGNEPPSFQLWANSIHPDDRDMAIKTVSDAASKAVELNVEYRVCYPDGTVHWLMSRGKPVNDEKSKKSRYIGTVIDITERKKSEQKISQSKAQLETALASMSDAVFLSDYNGNFTHFNRAFATFHKFRNIEECAKTFAEYPEILDVFMANGERAPVEQWAVPRALRGETATNAEYTLRRKDTGETWTGNYSFAPIRSDDGKITGSVVAVRDVTEQKLMQTAIKESELKFRSIFDYSPVAIGIGIDMGIPNISRSLLFNVNDAWLKLFGYTRSEIMDHPVSDLELYVDIDEREKMITALNTNGRIINKPLKLRKRTGEVISVLYSAERIALADKPHLLVMMTDITLQELQQQSINQLEIAVADRTQQLQQELQRLHRFLRMISHEYRTPLAIIRVNLDLVELKNKSGNYSNRNEIIKIKRAIDRLVEVMDVSIRESRIFESGQKEELANFKIAPVIASQIDAFRSLWPERSLLYSEKLDNCEIFGDAPQLKLAIFNLLDNARKYSAPHSQIDVECYTEADEVVINIRNQGKSITKKEGEQFFEKYLRGRNASNTGGAGLGLWLVRNILNRHNGHVALEGISSGVKATVRLPLFKQDG